MGWISLVVALNLSFISSDIILHLLKRMDERKYQRAQESSFAQDPGTYHSKTLHKIQVHNILFE
jgi:hypothetical protein